MRAITNLLIFLALLGTALHGADDPHRVFRKRVQGFSEAELLKISSRQALSKAWLDRLSAIYSEENLKKELKELWSDEAMSYANRPSGDETLPVLHRKVVERLEALEGVNLLGTLQEDVLSPIPCHLWKESPKEEQPHLQIGLLRIPLYPAYPNGVMPSLAPTGGLKGPIIDVGLGGWDDLKGKTLEGSIALLDYSGAEHWQRLMSAGALGVLVVQDSKVGRSTSEYLYCNTPIPFPRYVIPAEVGALLREKHIGVEVKVSGGHLYEERTSHTILAHLQAPETTPYVVSENDLLSRVASEAGLPLFELQRANPGLKTPLGVGASVAIPDRDPYQVVSNDLPIRIAEDLGIDLEILQKANPDLKGADLAHGITLSIPTLENPMVLFAPIDATSSVPDLPHGMHALSNLGASLLLFEELSRAPAGLLRRDVVLILVDGDAHGGMGSRSMAEALLLDREARLGTGLYPSAMSGGPKDVEIRQASFDFFNGTNTSIDEESSQWLSNWLVDRIEGVRVTIAEERVAAKARAKEAGRSPLVDTDVLHLEGQIEAISHPKEGLRQYLEHETVTQDHLNGFWTQLKASQLDGLMLPLSPNTLLTQLELELKLNIRKEARKTRNAKTIERYVSAVDLDQRSKSKPSMLGFRFLLGDESTNVGIGATKLYRGTKPDKILKVLGGQFRNNIAYASVTGQWDNPWAFAGDQDKSLYPVSFRDMPPIYGDMWTVAQTAIVPVVTLSDQFSKVDSPLDTYDHFNFANFSRAARTAATMFSICVESPNTGSGPKNLKEPQFGRVGGMARAFNLRSGIDAKEPVPDVMMTYPAFNKGMAKAWNSSTWVGTRPAVMRRTGIDGRYILPVENLKYKKSTLTTLLSHRLNREKAVVDMVMNRGQIGTKKESENFSLLSMQDIEKNPIMTEAYPFVFAPGVDPVDYRNLGEKNIGQLEIVDAVMDGEPKYFGSDIPSLQYQENNVVLQLVYGEPGRRFRFFWKSGPNNTMLLIGDGTEEPKGSGYPIGPQTSITGEPERNLVLTHTALHVAQDMMQRSRWRYQKYESKGIRDQQIAGIMNRAQEKLDEALAAKEKKDWQTVNGAAREAWGLLIRAYPKLMTLGREAIFSLIVMMALMVPCSWFLERLLVGVKAIVTRLIWMVIFFSAAMFFYYLFHPALQIIHSAFIVVVAFVMILISAMVLFISYQRFTVLMRRATASAGEVKAENISFFGTVATAMNLGINNLRKRKSRTLLTSFTVSALTFSIISFVSVKGSASIQEMIQALDNDVEGELVEPMTPNYEGLVFRESYWAAINSSFASAVDSEFGRMPKTRFMPPLKTVVRSSYLEIEGGNNADRDGANQIQVSRQGDQRSSIIMGMVGLEPDEIHFTGLNQAVNRLGKERYAGTWFTEDHVGVNRFVTILASNTAAELGIEASSLIDEKGQPQPIDRLPTVAMRGKVWRVIGILDVEKADLIRDANGKSLSMVDYLRSAFTPSAGGGSDLTQEPDSYHVSWNRLAIVPQSAADDIDARLKSVAVRFPKMSDPEVKAAIDREVESGISREEATLLAEQERADFLERSFQDIAMRLNRAMFSHRDGKIALISTASSVSIGGLAKIIVPVILCVLIVFNTMMGTVDERKGEVVMLGSVGLSPGQISLLLLAESLVYSVLGIILGTGAGLIFSAFSASFSFSNALSFNFTSIISMGLALGTGAVVIIATLIPARKAAALAAPSGMMAWTLPEPEDGAIDFQLPFTLTRGNAVGMTSFFKNFLNNHTDSGSEGFNCRNIELRELTSPAALEITADMWLAPYDLDVAQHLSLQIRPTTSPGVFGVWIRLTRRSGSEDAWVRTNYGFMDDVRLQFLLWRNLHPDRRGEFIEDGVEQFKGTHKA